MSAITADRLVEGADVVLGLGEVDAGLAAVGRVDLGDQRRRHLHDAHAALVGGRAEAGEVADDAAADARPRRQSGSRRARTISVQMISAWATVFDCSPGMIRMLASAGSNSSP